MLWDQWDHLCAFCLWVEPRVLNMLGMFSSSTLRPQTPVSCEYSHVKKYFLFVLQFNPHKEMTVHLLAFYPLDSVNLYRSTSNPSWVTEFPLIHSHYNRKGKPRFKWYLFFQDFIQVYNDFDYSLSHLLFSSSLSCVYPASLFSIFYSYHIYLYCEPQSLTRAISLL